ncbi:MAG: DUF928 domain-containing protein, partial [Cyanobacteria bacterium J06636_28]
IDPQAPQLTSIFPDDDLGYTTSYRLNSTWLALLLGTYQWNAGYWSVVNEDEGIFQPVYQTAFAPSSTAGIATLQLPDAMGLAPLRTDNYYYWSVEIYCPDDTAAVMTAEGFVELLRPDPILAEALANSEGLDRAAIAAENSLWFDTTRALSDHLQTQPNDLQAIENWQTLLESIGLENIADAPLLP